MQSKGQNSPSTCKVSRARFSEKVPGLTLERGRIKREHYPPRGNIWTGGRPQHEPERYRKVKIRLPSLERETWHLYVSVGWG